MTLSEIAEARLPGLPATRQGVAAKADREGWAGRRGMARSRQGRGGGMEFSIEILPPGAQAELVKRKGALSEAQQPVASMDGLPADQQARRDARLWVLSSVEQFARENGLKAYPADLMFAAAFNTRNLDIPEWVLSIIAQTSRERIRTWRKLRDTHGADALGADDRGRTRLLDTALDGKLRSSCLAVMAAKPFVQAKHVRAYILETFGADLDRAPSIRDVQRAMARWEREFRNELLRLRDPDGYRSKVEFTAVGSTTADHLNELWQIDASPADVMLKGGKRHSIYLNIDIYSRRVIILVTPTPRAAAVGALTRKSLIKWGKPGTIKTDNGSDFKARATERLFTALGINIEVSPVYDPKTKGNVERVIGTFQRDLATCPGFIGHSVADRKVLENRKAFNQRLGADAEALFDVEMDLPEFQAWCDDWAEMIYGHAAHSSLRGKSPFQKAAEYRGTIQHVEDVRALDILLAPAASGDGIRTVTKQGVRIDGHHYYTAAAMPGTRVLVRMDPADMGRALLFAEDGEAWLGEAICPKLAGLDPVETIQKVKAAQKEHEKERLRDIRKEMRQIGPHTVSDALMNQARKKAESVVSFPPKSEPYSTPALRAAAEAICANPDAPSAKVHDRAELDRKRAALIAPMKPAPKSTETPKQRFRRALAIEADLRAGVDVDPADEAWLRTYQQQPQYRAQRMIFEDLGMAMFA